MLFKAKIAVYHCVYITMFPPSPSHFVRLSSNTKKTRTLKSGGKNNKTETSAVNAPLYGDIRRGASRCNGSLVEGDEENEGDVSKLLILLDFGLQGYTGMIQRAGKGEGEEGGERRTGAPD